MSKDLTFSGSIEMEHWAKMGLDKLQQADTLKIHLTNLQYSLAE